MLLLYSSVVSAGVLTLVLHAQLALTRCGSEALRPARAKLDSPESVCKVKWRRDGTSSITANELRGDSGEMKLRFC